MTARTGVSTRRDFLAVSAAAFASVGAAAALWPAIDQMNPDASTRALASIEVDVSSVRPGQSITVLWRGKPVFIRHRTPSEIAKARASDVQLLIDPVARMAGLPVSARATDGNRTKPDQPAWLVVVGVCTHLGCIPQGQRMSEKRGDWGGWFCSCHGSQYDTSGRVRQGPAPQNLDVPPYHFLGSSLLEVGRLERDGPLV